MVGLLPAGAGRAAVSRGGLAHGAAQSCSAGGQRQHRGVHPGVSPGTLPQGCQKTLRQSWQEVKKRGKNPHPQRWEGGLFDIFRRFWSVSSSACQLFILSSSGIQSLCFMTSWSRRWMLTGTASGSSFSLHRGALRLLCSSQLWCHNYFETLLHMRSNS